MANIYNIIKQNPMDIDWNKLWQDERAKRSWQGKKKQDWNNRAAGFARRNSHSPYVDAFLSKISVDSGDSVLDVGAGPGTLSIPLASLVREVTALDFSSEMLAILSKRCKAASINNVKAVEGAWEDDWQGLGVQPHDVVVASRSLAVKDLKSALLKLNGFAEKKVIISDRVGSGPFDAAIFTAVGREFTPGPDYIYTVNILYQMGIKASVDFITSGGASVYKSKQEAFDAWSWMMGELSALEEQKFIAHLESRLVKVSDTDWRLENQTVPTWAIIQWERQ
jgi:SAM-dependent methyltransferase